MQQSTLERQAEFLQQAANGLCWLRIAATPAIAGYILTHPDYQSPTLAKVVGGLYVGDKIDGRLADWSKRLYKRAGVESPGNPRLDELSDKIMTHGTLGAIVLREVLNENYSYAAAIASIETVALTRDILVNKKRSAAQLFNDAYLAQLAEHDIAVPASQQVKTGANFLGQLKQTGFVGAVTTAVSPHANSEPGHAVVVGLLAGSGVLSVVSGVDKFMQLGAEQAELQANFPLPSFDA